MQPTLILLGWIAYVAAINAITGTLAPTASSLGATFGGALLAFVLWYLPHTLIGPRAGQIAGATVALLLLANLYPA